MLFEKLTHDVTFQRFPVRTYFCEVELAAKKAFCAPNQEF